YYSCFSDICFGDSITPISSEVQAEEGQAVTLICNYNTTSTGTQYLFWYRQSPNRSPEYLIQTDTYSGSNRKDGYETRVDKDSKRVWFKISEPGAADGAVYYCALRPTVIWSSRAVLVNLTVTQFHLYS
ncbi:TVA1 protein, partial [Atractosteus spatula]|nr:TVA1 protein [Atractosteus spatula]MBN3321917.1 TVA1 protein [Atractosteus spatula]